MRIGITFLLLGLIILCPAAAQEYDLDIEIDLDTLDLPPLEEVPDLDDRNEIDFSDSDSPGFDLDTYSPSVASFSLYGYLVNFSTVNLYSGGQDPRADLGNILYMRMKGDFEPEDFLQFHFEASFTGSTGNQNGFALMDSYGMIPEGPMEAGENPYEDFIQSFAVDHLWGSISLRLIDLQFGKIPLAWGTGYVFNPTARVAASAFMDTVAEETPGTLAVSAGGQLPGYWSLQGYAAFQDKTHTTGASLEDGAFNNLPLGLKLTGVAGSYDFSFGMVKEVIKAGEVYNRNYYAVADFAGALGPFGIYGEAALAMPGENSLSLDFSGWKPVDSLEGVLGFDYEFARAELTLRGEYYHYGPGTADPDDYDNTLALTGAAMVQGRDYLFLHLERLFQDYLTLSLGAMSNLNDFSTVLFPDISYEFASDFSVSAGSLIFLSGEGGEFGGDYGPLEVDLTTPAVYLRMKLSF